MGGNLVIKRCQNIFNLFFKQTCPMPCVCTDSANMQSTLFQKNNFALPTTVGSKSTKTARGTCFPAPVSLKNVLKESSPPPIVLSLGI